MYSYYVNYKIQTFNLITKKQKILTLYKQNQTSD